MKPALQGQVESEPCEKLRSKKGSPKGHQSEGARSSYGNRYGTRNLRTREGRAKIGQGKQDWTRTGAAAARSGGPAGPGGSVGLLNLKGRNRHQYPGTWIQPGPLIIAQVASEMVWAQFSLNLELVDQTESMGQGKAVLEIWK